MAQKKKSKTQPTKNSSRKMSRGQKIMAVIGVLIIISMILPYILR
jgi:hypothetical protein